MKIAHFSQPLASQITQITYILSNHGMLLLCIRLTSMYKVNVRYLHTRRIGQFWHPFVVGIGTRRVTLRARLLIAG